MGWTDRLRRLALGDPQRELAAALQPIYERTVERAARFAASADQAPNPSAERALRHLAAEEEKLANALAEAMSGRGAPPPAPAAAALNGAAHNHWARLVGALDACRDARDQIARAMPDLLALDPSLAPLLDALTRQLAANLDTLRELVARADPHARN